MTKLNMNSLEIPTDGNDWEPLRDYGVVSGSAEVIFRNLEDRLIREIERSDIVVGCVAWLTSKRIVRALSRVSCCIIVQKEDFLRPDDDGSKSELQTLYGLLSNQHNRFEFWNPLGAMTTCGDAGIEGVRCVGNHNRSRFPAFPRSHHKFVVFGKREMRDGSADCPDDIGVSEARFSELLTMPNRDVLAQAPIDWYYRFDRVWTGSFNFTQNAGRSFENAIILTDERIARAYLGEFSQVAALSEPLNWDDDWCAPEWRIGS